MKRSKLWVQACSRPDLLERSFQSLTYMHICSLHFEKRMYSKKTLKRTAIPTLFLPTHTTAHTHSQTDPEVNILDDVILRSCDKLLILKPKATQTCHKLAGPSSQFAETTDKTKYIGIDSTSQTPARLTAHIPRKRKLRDQVSKINKKLKLTEEKCQEITESQFLKGCDNFLSPKLSAIVKAQIYLRPHCKNNRYSREFKLFCLNIYYSSPLAYRFLSKTICLPSKSTLASMYLPIEPKVNQQTWDVLIATTKHMSSSEKECVLCMDEMSLKLNLFYDTKGRKEDKILGLHEVDGQQKPVAAGYAFTLMLRGITSNWKQPIGFSFISSSKIDDQLKTWITTTVQRFLQLGFNIRAFVSDLGSDFLALSKTLGISKNNSCFEIYGRKIYYIFDVPHSIKCVRNNLINYNFEFDGKTVR
ncbi:uncharacterized protein LOC133517572 [Cydia pomonella]|uniref:uncharacterized protein LOC133517572 n=1 Tax=Cydia pomonella TaxID=82600 RepID=UPI002ADD6629|nr:uncharacterized protein LOC133517572 [Cydia pomonella]